MYQSVVPHPLPSETKKTKYCLLAFLLGLNAYGPQSGNQFKFRAYMMHNGADTCIIFLQIFCCKLLESVLVTYLRHSIVSAKTAQFSTILQLILMNWCDHKAEIWQKYEEINSPQHLPIGKSRNTQVPIDSLLKLKSSTHTLSLSIVCNSSILEHECKFA